MKLIRLTILPALLMCLCCAMVFAQPKKLEQFRKVFNHKGKEPIYIVVAFRNLKDNEKKEVATTMALLEGAVAINEDLNDNDPKIRKIIQANDSLVFPFEFRNALDNVSFNLYNDADLRKFAKKVNIDSIRQYISKNPAVNTKLRASSKGWEAKFTNKAKGFDFKKDRLMFAHLLYKEGILTYLSDPSFGGISYLPY
jgi:hypothetical protein